ncbi:hypothetical protein BDA99DRAFT_416573, partial [Phascolomyces articulosus]
NNSQVSENRHKRRKYVYDYISNSVAKWEPNEEWILDGLNITMALQKFRNRSFSMAKRDENLSDNRVLSLSNIFVITSDQARSSFHRFSPVYHDKIIGNYPLKTKWERLPLKARVWCDDTDDENEDKDDDEENDDGSSEDSLLLVVATILGSLVEIFASWTANCTLESSFQKQHLTVFLDHVFNSNQGIKVREGETHLIDNPSSLMADYIGSYTSTTDETFDLLAVEVKPPQKSSNHQLQSDYVKVGKEMKEMVDRLVKKGISNPITCGILVEGYEMRTYSLQLVADGVYLMIEHGFIELLRYPQSVCGVPGIMEHLMQLKSILSTTI